MADQLNNGHAGELRRSILAADDLPIQHITIPEWGMTVCIRTMTGGERDRFEAEWRRDSTSDVRARLAVATVCDPDGALLFTEADVPALTRKSSKALDRIFAASTVLSGLTDRDVEDLRKN